MTIGQFTMYGPYGDSRSILPLTHLHVCVPGEEDMHIVDQEGFPFKYDGILLAKIIVYSEPL